MTPSKPRDQGDVDETQETDSRLMELKALEKSRRRVQHTLSGRDDIKWEVAWTMASQAPQTLTPNCKGQSKLGLGDARERRGTSTLDVATPLPQQ